MHAADLSAALGSVLPELRTAADVTPALPHRRRIGRAHTARVDALLRKYLEQQAGPDVGAAPDLDLIHLEPGSPPPGPVAGATVKASPRPAQGRPPGGGARMVKSIMQVKGEQDAAIRELQHAPRTFRATPVPLAVAAPRKEQPAKTPRALAAEGRSLVPDAADPAQQQRFVADAVTATIQPKRPQTARPKGSPGGHFAAQPLPELGEDDGDGIPAVRPSAPLAPKFADDEAQ